MTIEAEEAALFSRWNERKRQNGELKIIRDGAMKPRIFEKVKAEGKTKIVFALKEANDPDGQDWSLSDVVYEHDRWMTWDNLARWTLALSNLEDPPVWSDAQPMDVVRRRLSLETVAAVNLKKCAGGDSSIRSEILKAAKVDADLLLEQFNLYQADIIVCCGESVFDGLHEHVFPNPQISDYRSNGPHNCHSFLVGNNTTVFDFWHPQYAGKTDQFMYEALIEVARNALKN